jgi:hypothetical protein
VGISRNLGCSLCHGGRFCGEDDRSDLRQILSGIDAGGEAPLRNHIQMDILQ